VCGCFVPRRMKDPVAKPAEAVSRAGRIVSGFAWVMTGEGVKTALQLLLFVILARLLQPKDYGLMALLLIPMSFLQIFASMGTRQALIQKAELTSDHLSTSFYLNLASGLILWGLLWAASDSISRFFRSPEM